MAKAGKGKRMGKTKATVLRLAVALPLLTVALSLAGAKLMLSGLIGQEHLLAAACVIGGLVALAAGFYAARRAPQKKLVWGMVAAGGYVCALLLGNLLFFGEGFGAILPVAGCCIGGGFLGSLTAAAKRRKFA